MMRILAVLTLAGAIGVTLSVLSLDGPLRPGLLGAALLLIAAIAARRHWRRQRASAPGSPERSFWIGLVSSSLIAGHLLGALWQIGPEMHLHSLAAHAFAIDNWTLVFAGGMAWWIARDPEPRQDERDLLIAAAGTRAAYFALVALLIGLLMTLAFGGDLGSRTLTHAMIAHLLIVAILISCIVANASTLRAYAGDSKEAGDAGA